MVTFADFQVRYKNVIKLPKNRKEFDKICFAFWLQGQKDTKADMRNKIERTLYHIFEEKE